MLKIAIYGKAKTGKDTVAKIIYKILSDPSHEVLIESFANPIKKLVTEFFDFKDSYKYLYGSSELRSYPINESNISYRELLCDVGELFKKYDPNIWIKKTFQYIQNRINENTFFLNQESQETYTNYQPSELVAVVISDMRFLSEYNAVCAENYFKVKLTKPNNDYSHNHISETELEILPDNSFDYHLCNDGDMSQLEFKINEMLSYAKNNFQCQF